MTDLQELRNVTTWEDVGLRSSVGNPGVRKEGDYWRYFDDAGDYPGKFANAEAARWGCWMTPERIARINPTRLITVEDARKSMVAAMEAMSVLRRDSDAAR